MSKGNFLITVFFLIAVIGMESCSMGKNKIPGVYVFEYEVDSNMIKCYKGIPIEENKLPELNPVNTGKKRSKKFTCYEDAVLIYFNYKKLILKKDSTCVINLRSDFDENVEYADTGNWYVSNDTLYTHYEGEMFLSRWVWQENVLYECVRIYGEYARRSNVFLGYKKGDVPLKKRKFL